ncbi:uncharacterized protein LOC110647104 [Hevea brasiliensis]|uniref:uncharacterized protein LOC110647104 n=1 Tax=Hevea brasiliensis TaxID=3981 RepID=UPI0025FE309C|nr:uncharacterized protein LOC110647104 [Hevea brasiliensis]
MVWWLAAGRSFQFLNFVVLGKEAKVLSPMAYAGLMEHHKDIVEYFNARGVSAIFLFRRNLLRWMVSVLSNSYDRHAKLLNGMHKSHVHSAEEAETLSKYKPTINCTLLIADLKEMEIMAARAYNTRHIVLYSEDLVKNGTLSYHDNLC